MMKIKIKTGDSSVVFGGGCGSCNLSLCKTRPPPSSATCCTDLASCGGGRRRAVFSGNGHRRGETVVQDRGHSRRSRADARARAQSHSNSAYGGATSNSLVSEARRYIGTNPTGRGSLWCGAFMDLVLKRTGHAGGGNLASAYARYGTRVSGPQVGAIAVMGRRGGGHVGVVSGVDPNGNPIIVSGNHNHTVAESVYPAGRISAYVLPGG